MTIKTISFITASSLVFSSIATVTVATTMNDLYEGYLFPQEQLEVEGEAQEEEDTSCAACSIGKKLKGCSTTTDNQGRTICVCPDDVSLLMNILVSDNLLVREA